MVTDKVTIADLVARTEALADATRLRVLRLLERHELGVNDLMDVLQLPQSSVSRHLKLLCERGFVTTRSHGPSNLYAMHVSELPPDTRRLWQAVREQCDTWPAIRQDELRLARRLDGRGQASHAYFSRAAGQWERLRRELYGAVFGDAALRGLLPREWTVADLACGAGSVAAALAPHVARVVAVDGSTAMLRAAKKRLSAAANVELRHGALEALPIDGASCDAALLLLGLAYVRQPAAAVAEAARILKPGGRLSVVDLLRHDREDFRRQTGQQRLGFDPDELRSLITEAGLVCDHCAPLAPEPGAKGPALLLASASRPKTLPELNTPSRPSGARGTERKHS
jgi:SAM-dependent methyltransferase/predicted transcriptional regulator